MEANKPQKRKLGLTGKILLAMVLGILLGIFLHSLPSHPFIDTYVIDGLFDVGGQIFITLLKMLVVPIVFVSIVCGTCNLGEGHQFSRLATKTILLYVMTTALAIFLAIVIASLFNVGGGDTLVAPPAEFQPEKIPSLKQTLLNIFPSNPLAAMASGNMLQIIVFAVLLGIAISRSGEFGERIQAIFKDLDVAILELIHMVIRIAPYGVFCLVTTIFARLGFDIIGQLFGYFMTVILALMVQLFFTYGLLLRVLAGLNPFQFFRKMSSAMIFAFSTSSSNASIPIVLDTVETKLGVKNSVASFIVPLGATINMDGTAIMQGVATVFISNIYNIEIGVMGYLMVILTATMASIGTAGIPSVGLITLTLVLQQVGLPIEGIALIIGVDRLLDMIRTAVNTSGDATVACIVAKSENAMDLDVYQRVDK